MVKFVQVAWALELPNYYRYDLPLHYSSPLNYEVLEEEEEEEEEEKEKENISHGPIDDDDGEDKIFVQCFVMWLPVRWCCRYLQLFSYLRYVINWRTGGLDY